MEEISSVGIDIAKSVFQVHVIDVDGNIVVRRQLRPTDAEILRAGSALPHRYRGLWDRLLLGATTFGLRHDVRLMPPAWFEAGAADGFVLIPAWLPGGLEDFIDEVVPKLQKSGLFRTSYEGRTLRENLGLVRPTVGQCNDRLDVAAVEG
jgi:alkanesulfonate monooxygenase SsuD/methylene tetrahydromethanopterin reductase-like flavin-dependent oxidoreductase (luciferase family)